MTAALQPSQIWSTMPGWGIVTDLTPPELIASRRLKLVRKLLGACLIVLLVLLLAGYGYASLQAHSASSALASEQSRTSQLRMEENRYGAVTRIRSSIESLHRQEAGLMTGDVDLTAQLGQLRGALPAGMAINNIDLTISATATAAAGAANSLDTSGRPQVGKIKLTGTSRALDDLATYVIALQKIPGVIDVLPISNQASGNVFSYALSMSMTDEVLSHQFANTGSK